MNQLIAYVRWLFKRPVWPSIAFREIVIPIQKDNRLNAWGDFDHLVIRSSRDRYGRKTESFHLNGEKVGGVAISKKDALELIELTAIENLAEKDVIF